MLKHVCCQLHSHIEEGLIQCQEQGNDNPMFAKMNNDGSGKRE